MSQKILITCALPYANGPLHFGHIAGAYLPADCYARFQRLMGREVLFICGSDEYGVAITLSAELAGRTPQQQVDLYHQVNRDFFKQLQISFDHFSRTTWKGHPETVCAYFRDLCANGYIEPRETLQLYSEADRRFLADRYVVGTCPRCAFDQARGDECPRCGASYEATELKHPRSKMTGAALVLKETRHWFLLLDKFKEPLQAFIASKQWKPNVVNFAKHYIDDLRPRAITRDLEWGVPVPLEEAKDKVFYVWFDACIGYISATKEWALLQHQPNLWQHYWCDPATKLVNFMGKDNIPFHAVLFPAMTMGQNQPYKLVDELVANEFYNLEGKQFSKSDGWSIDLEQFFRTYTSDQIRYTIAANAPETADAEFTWKDFQTRCNSELLGKYGNLANRILVFLQKQCGGKVPEAVTLTVEDQQFLEAIQALASKAALAFEGFKVRHASQLIMELAQLGNGYFDGRAPWKSAKHPETRSEMETTLSCCLECLKVLALISLPVIPDAATKLWGLLGYALPPTSWERALHTPLEVGKQLPEPYILFQRIEDSAIEQELQKFV